jgi:hypothetical protein
MTMPSRRIPFAENDQFAIWRLQADAASDIVFHKETGRWAVGVIAAKGLDARAVGCDADRQEAIAALACELDLELMDGSPASAPEGPSLGM